MQPEQSRTSLALQSGQADSAPRGILSTGLLRGLTQSIRPPFFCFLLPRVHAADVAAAQPAQMLSSSSSSPAPVPAPSPSILPSNIGKPEFPDTGWERIKDLFDRELVFLAVTVGLYRLNLGLRGLVAGTIIGAVLGIPVGGLVVGLQSLTGETVRERRRRERRELYELKLAEWTARLQLTDELIDNLNVSSQAAETNKDMQRIQELLSLPQNEDVSKN